MFRACLKGFRVAYQRVWLWFCLEASDNLTTGIVATICLAFVYLTWPFGVVAIMICFGIGIFMSSIDL